MEGFSWRAECLCQAVVGLENICIRGGFAGLGSISVVLWKWWSGLARSLVAGWCVHALAWYGLGTSYFLIRTCFPGLLVGGRGSIFITRVEPVMVHWICNCLWKALILRSSHTGSIRLPPRLRSLGLFEWIGYPQLRLSLLSFDTHTELQTARSHIIVETSAHRRYFQPLRWRHEHDSLRTVEYVRVRLRCER